MLRGSLRQGDVRRVHTELDLRKCDADLRKANPTAPSVNPPLPENFSVGTQTLVRSFTRVTTAFHFGRHSQTKSRRSNPKSVIAARSSHEIRSWLHRINAAVFQPRFHIHGSIGTPRSLTGLLSASLLPDSRNPAKALDPLMMRVLV